MYKSIKKKNKFETILLGSLGLLLFGVLLWAETSPIRNKTDYVYYKGQKHFVPAMDIKGDSIILILDNDIRVNIDSVTSAKPRNSVSWITDWRTKHKI
ncbi:hypothetical protein B0O44_11283 [Pedobacter nutrimenti]|uniref:Uncharacterized protein n=2 Tax=Pedobacter nutrimenti TaxID=1241337 RepID=A0A318U9E0_9SPHI|nr:hypothetical protein B0O44_11283 [Pedobacter nutrimenti]